MGAENNMRSNRPRPSGQGQRGFSIIELMVAATIAIMLLAGAAGLFVSNKRIYREQEESAILQENGRFAIQVLYESLRMANFRGCSIYPLQINNPVEGFIRGAGAIDKWAPSESNALVADIKGGTDAVTVRYVVRHSRDTDCSDGGDSRSEVASRFHEVTRRFYIGDHDGEPSLFCSGNGADGLCNGNVMLVRGIEDMRILYGDGRHYRPADTVGDDWHEITGIKIAILARTESRTPNSNEYYLLDEKIGPVNDNFRRRVFTNHVLIRNRHFINNPEIKRT